MMPGVGLLEWASNGVVVRLHTSATDLLLATYTALCRKEVSATIVLAHALYRSQAEHNRLEALLRSSQQQGLVETAPQRQSVDGWSPLGRNFWLTLWTGTQSTAENLELQFVASCLSWRLGDYPIFLWSSDQPGSTSSAALDLRIGLTTTALLQLVPPQRVFSVFGRVDLVTAFERSWTSRTSISREVEPFYAAFLTYCTRETFRSSSATRPASDRLRRADLSDLDSVALLCKEFADTSIYFPLTPERGKEEALWLIERQLIWVYETDGKIVSICAVARQSQNVAVVTKAYTTPKWRRKGFAERLVRKVTGEMLTTKQRVALYVGRHNDAQHIYDRVGFVGLCGKDRPSGVEDVLEIGFCGTDRGYW